MEHCRPCKAEYMAARYAADPEKYIRAVVMNRQRKKRGQVVTV